MSDALARGKALEASGDTDGAVEAYVEARAAGDAARVLAMQGRLEDAGHAILRALGVAASDVGSLPASERELTKQAAAFFKSYRTELAETINEALANAGPPPPEAEPVAPAAAPAPAAPPAAAPVEPGPVASPRPTPAPRRGTQPPAALTKPLPAKPGPREPAGASGSFRAPVRGSGGESLRAPSAGGSSFRPPRASGGFRPPGASGSSVRAPKGLVTRSVAPEQRVSRAPGSPAVREERVGRAPSQPAVREERVGRAPSQPAVREERVGRAPSQPAVREERVGRVPSQPAVREERVGRAPRSPSSSGTPKEERIAREPSQPSRTPRQRTPAPSKAPSRPPRQRTPPPSKPPSDRPRTPSPGSIASGSFTAPRVTEKPPPQDPLDAPKGQKLSASGGAVTDYAGSRATGWRGAGSAAIERSIEELVDGGRKGAAARIARDAGQFERALGWFQELGLHYQAGACLRELGRTEEALAELLAVESEGNNYHKACLELVTVSLELGRLDFDTDRFLTAFVDQGPKDKDEFDRFLELAQVYANAGFLSSSRRCALKVVGMDPTHEEALRLAGEARQRANPRAERAPRPRMSSAEGLPPLPPLEEFIALAKEHAPG